MEVSFWGYLASTAIAAFAASLAAVAVTMELDRRARRRQAKAVLLRAIAAHIDRLWEYGSVCAQIRTAGAGNGATKKGQTMPARPSIHALIAEIHALRGDFGSRAAPAIDEVIEGVQGIPHAVYDGAVADWPSEAGGLGQIAETIAAWDGKSATLLALDKD